MKKIIALFFFITALLISATASESQVAKSAKGQFLPSNEIKRKSPYFNEMISSESHQVFFEDFESLSNEWSIGGSWEIGEPSIGPKSGSISNKCVSVSLHDEYKNNAEDWLISPRIYIPDQTDKVFLKFDEWFRLETGHDFGYVKISTDFGDNWTKVSSTNGTSIWRETIVDLTAYQGQSVLIAFYFSSDESETNQGWFIDNLRIKALTRSSFSATLNSLNTQNFPLVYMNVGVDIDDDETLDSSNFSVYENGIIQTNLFHVTPPEHGGSQRLADIIVVLDVTGSMGPYIAAVKNNLLSFISALGGSDINYNVGFVTFGDIVHVYNNYNLYSDLDQIMAIANAISLGEHGIGSGGDWPENQLGAMAEAAQFNFRPGAQRIQIMITDAPSHENNHITPWTVETLINNMLLPNNITVFPVFNTNCSPSAAQYIPIANATNPNGTYFHIYDNFNEILEEIGGMIGNTYIVRYSSSNPDCDGVLREVDIAITYEEETITLSGSYIPCMTPTIERTTETIALHNQPWAENTLLTLEVNVYDPSEPYVDDVKLFYRVTGTPNYANIPMDYMGDNLWSANVPTSAVLSPGLDYYFTATDGIHTVSDPVSEPSVFPYQLAILPNVAPVIEHTPLVSLIAGQPIVIEATITDDTNYLEDQRLFYRSTGQILYQSVEMDLVSGDLFSATIPSEYVVSEGVHYYLSAWDNFGVRTDHGSASNPHIISEDNFKIFISNIHVKQETDKRFHAYDPNEVIGILVDDKVRFEGQVLDLDDNPVSNKQVTVYSSVDYDPDNGNNGVFAVNTDENGIFFFPSADTYKVMDVYAGAYAFWFSVSQQTAIPFLMLISDETNTFEFINQKLRENLPDDDNILDIRLQEADVPGFEELSFSFIPYPPNQDDLLSEQNKEFFFTYMINYTGPVNFNFLLDDDEESGWLDIGLTYYGTKVDQILNALPEKFKSLVPLDDLFDRSYDWKKRGNLLSYAIGGAVCATTLIPTGVTQVVGPIGCKFVLVNAAKDVVKTVATNPDVQSFIGIEGNPEIDAGIILAVDVAAILISPLTASKSLAYWQNPRNLANGGQFLGTSIQNGRLAASAMMVDDFYKLANVAGSAWDYSQVSALNYQNHYGYYRGSIYQNIHYNYPVGNYTSTDISFAFTRVSDPVLDFSNISQNDGLLTIDLTASRPLFTPGTTIETNPELVINGVLSFPMNLTTPVNNEVRRYTIDLPWEDLPGFDPNDPDNWDGSLSAQGFNFETRIGSCVGNQCGINNYHFTLPNTNRDKEFLRNTYAELIIEEYTFVEETSLVTFNLVPFKVLSSQQHLIPRSYVFNFNSSSEFIDKPIKLVIHYENDDKTNGNELAMFKLNDQNIWIEVDATFDDTTHSFVLYDTEPGTYMVAEGLRGEPAISVDHETDINFWNTIVGDCSIKEIQINGNNILNGIIIESTGEFLISTQDESFYAKQLFLYENKGIVDKTVFIKFCPESADYHSGSLKIMTPNAEPVYVELHGLGIPASCIPPQAFEVTTDANIVSLEWTKPVDKTRKTTIFNTEDLDFSKNGEKLTKEDISIKTNYDGVSIVELANKDEDNVILSYDGPNYNAIGLVGGGTFYGAVRFPSELISDYLDYALTEVVVYIHEEPINITLTIFNQGTNETPGDIIHQQVINPEADSWHNVSLDNALSLDEEDIWVGFEVNHEAGTFILGADNGPAHPDGQWVTNNLLEWNKLTDFGINRNWNIKAVLTPHEALEVVGYNIYRNETLIASLDDNTFHYEDVILEEGEYNYDVTAVYDECESGTSGTIMVDIDFCHPSWTPAPNLLFNMQITARLHIDGEVSLNPNDVIGAFVDGECRGIASPQPHLNGLVFLTVGSNIPAGESIELVVWNSQLCEPCQSHQIIEFQNLGQVGTPGNPLIVECSDYVIIDFGEGFTWFSINLDPGSMDPNALFTELSPCENDRIIGQVPYATFTGGSWIGSLVEIKPFERYVMELCTQQQFELYGTPVSIEPISLEAGYTWLGYLPKFCLPTNTALDDILPSPAEEDRIISQSAYAMFIDGEWVGSLSQMCPGDGFVIDLSHDVILTYPDPFLKDMPIMEKRDYQYSPAGIYPENNKQFVMTLLANLKDYDGKVSLNENDVVYAFVDDECRGMAKPMANHNGSIFMSISSNSPIGEIIHFKAWIEEKQELLAINEILPFETMRGIGTMQEPYYLTFDNPLSVEEDPKPGWYIGDAYPNPFNRSTLIPYILTEPATMTLNVFNSLGQLVYDVTIDHTEQGTYEVKFDRNNLPQGVYFFKLTLTDNHVQSEKTGRMMIIQ